MLEFKLGATNPIVEGILPHPTHIKVREPWQEPNDSLSNAQKARTGLVEGVIPYNGNFTSGEIKLPRPFEYVKFAISTESTAFFANAVIMPTCEAHEYDDEFNARQDKYFRRISDSFEHMGIFDCYTVAIWHNVVRLLDPKTEVPHVVINNVYNNGIRIYLGADGAIDRQFTQRDEFREHVQTLVDVTQQAVNYAGKYAKRATIPVAFKTK